MPERKRPWTVTALSLLLFLESIALVSIGSFRTYIIKRTEESALTIEMVGTPVFVILEGLLALLTFTAAVGFFRLWRIAWIFAMLVQGIVLFFLLRLHFIGAITNDLDYGVMAFVVFIVLYLNYHEVQALFRFEVGETLE